MRYAVIDTPMGPLTVGSTENGLASIQFGRNIPPNGMVDNQANCVVIEQLHEYFQGRRSRFELPIDFRGTPFQIAVWKELLTIPYGETRSYGDIAMRLGKPGAARAIGMANNKNPIAIVVPCHRVIGRDGSLTGYAGGLRIKSRLLTLESSKTDN